VPGSLDLCFIEGSLEPIMALEEARHPITAGPAPRAGALGRTTSIYCEDPDGNIVEVTTYSADRCAGWSVLAVLKLFGSRSFLGTDKSAASSPNIGRD
jgi:hypothetical protein